MIRFEYKARSKDNKKLNGLVDAIDQKQALKILRSRGLLVVGFKEKKSGLIAEITSNFQKVKAQDILDFTRELSTMITAGLSLTESMNVLLRQSSAPMQKILRQIIKDIEGGSSLYNAMSKFPKHFSAMYLALIKSGESAGVLDKILMRLSETLEQQKEFQSKIKGALIYPAIVVVGMLAVSVIMLVFVIPKITDMFLEFDLTLPMATRILMFVSDVLSRFWYIILIVLTAGFIFLRQWYKTDYGRLNIDELLIKMPIIGSLNEKSMFTEMTRTLSLLINGGVSIIEALNIVADVMNNKVYSDATKVIALDVEKGAQLGASFNRYAFFPPILSQMMAVGEETGKLDEVLMKVSRHFEMESEFAVKGLTSAIEPIMIILLGAGVGFLVVAVIMPIYKLTSSF